MKKERFLIVLLLISIIFFTGCGGANKTYTPPDDVEVVAVIARDSYNNPMAIPVIYNAGSKTIKDVTIAVAAYDNKGNLMDVSNTYDERKYFQSTYDTINLHPDEFIELAGIIPQIREGRYFEGIICEVEYIDGSIWETNAVDAWFNQLPKTFDVEKQKEKINSYADFAKAAEEEGYLMLNDIRLIRSHNINSLEHIISLKVKDIGNKRIDSFELCLHYYDKDGYPVSIGGFGIATNSQRIFEYGNNATSNQVGTLTLGMGYGAQTNAIKDAKGIVTKIEFVDGDVWTNPYTAIWELYKTINY